MKFNNTVAFCKGWYKGRGDVNTMWMDMSHCIQADGWVWCTDKKSVAEWCMSRMIDILQEFPSTAYSLSFAKFYSEMQKNNTMWKIRQNLDKCSPDLDEYDLIIWTFRDFIRFETKKEMYTEGVQPSEEVLPIYESAKSDWDMVKDYKVQVFGKFIPDYNEREARLSKI